MKVALLVFLMVCSTNVLAQVFQWQDEAGVVHFGDRVPAQFSAQAKQVAVNPPPATGTVAPPLNPEKTDSENNHASKKQDKANVDEVEQPSACELQWRRYEQAKACVDQCGIDQYTFGGSGIGRKHDCGCARVKKPRCNIN